MAKYIRELPLGAIVRLGVFEGEPIEWYVLDHEHTGYNQAVTTLLSRYGLKNVSFSGKNPSAAAASASNFYGYNDWRTSPLKQWLNSNASADAWWTSAYPGEPYAGMCDAPYDLLPGFLHEWAPADASLLIPVTVNVTAGLVWVGYAGGNRADPIIGTSSQKVYCLGEQEAGFPVVAWTSTTSAGSKGNYPQMVFIFLYFSVIIF